MHNKLKQWEDFHIDESVNNDVTEARAAINTKKEEISEEVRNGKDAETPADEAASLKKQASLYSQMPVLLNRFANAILSKEDAGDKTNIY